MVCVPVVSFQPFLYVFKLAQSKTQEQLSFFVSISRVAETFLHFPKFLSGHIKKFESFDTLNSCNNIYYRIHKTFSTENWYMPAEVAEEILFAETVNSNVESCTDA